MLPKPKFFARLAAGLCAFVISLASQQAIAVAMDDLYESLLGEPPMPEVLSYSSPEYFVALAKKFSAMAPQQQAAFWHQHFPPGSLLALKPATLTLLQRETTFSKSMLKALESISSPGDLEGGELGVKIGEKILALAVLLNKRQFTPELLAAVGDILTVGKRELLANMEQILRVAGQRAVLKGSDMKVSVSLCTACQITGCVSAVMGILGLFAELGLGLGHIGCEPPYDHHYEDPPPTNVGCHWWLGGFEIGVVGAGLSAVLATASVLGLLNLRAARHNAQVAVVWAEWAQIVRGMDPQVIEGLETILRRGLQ